MCISVGAALWRAVSFTKGCYIGQETIARLQQDPEVRVKQQLFGLKLGGPVETGTKLYAEEPAAELEPPTAKQLKMAGNLAKMMGEEVPDFASAEACQAWIASKL